ncbi:flavin monoamine oxidase family protein [Roseiconus lacunae]|uniref:FAD-dependent oxidoreductase n=1 Tax=Roseiconus lacunae TaxID=2605694 RepID=A0ABT7PLN8_9BACT|nr:FAD-dependent oxidoreductase [Roseiconus lacunae]MDM4017417.1 FAD-dependent oxidoreductase [Roseiconus lacunae]
MTHQHRSVIQPTLRRRELLALVAGVPLANLAGCNWQARNISGELLNPDFTVMHRLRDQWRPPKPSGDPVRHQVVIVGGGIAGLSAAWQLKQNGIDDFVVLELDAQVGGTARSGQHGNFRFPWGAHYVPVPMKDNDRLVKLFQEMGVIIGEDAQGEPIAAESVLCRDPQERVFVADDWVYGLYPSHSPSDEDRRQLEAFRNAMRQLAHTRDDQGRRLFAIPMSAGSDNDTVRELDRHSMAAWMNSQGYTSPLLRWLVDYGCRDDYGLTAEQTSAWAGVFYFASRLRNGAKETQEVMTWPEGNGRIVRFLGEQLRSHIRLRQVVTAITQDVQQARVTVFDAEQSITDELIADQVIFAAPQFIAPRLIPDFESTGRDVASFRYGGWVVANVMLHDRPRPSQVAMCWDNVIADGPSLGYVTSTHQKGIDHGPTVLTWYRPLTDDDPRISRSELMRLTWEDWVTVIVSDLSRPHPDIESLIDRIDVMRWGHAMIQPRPGFLFGGERERASESLGRIHFGASDLSGIALMEEAFDRGTRAADKAIAALRHDAPKRARFDQPSRTNA